ncbi:TRANSLOCON-ASSOCIATED PROTEIN SUBUNIT BETA-LIKE [Salix purpurea]|uniref:TRANSLOCON-ASSOCIATED PROTEIN SUBUNIT BETA-LIKE n=1 Tax=Salix purpurea TaxID=77065 RepID=A0A9Q0VTL5_SALPP|nr:TRANSLOCON-ASSOCIATED PROTEIN SUBUNIT BETA-LIKE [Salix purpurea]
MANQIATKMLFTLAISLLLVSSSIASSDVPFIVAHKKATLSSLKSGTERVSVSIDIFNQGSSTAYDITLVDDHWPQDMFNGVSGNTSRSWERLDAGGLLCHYIPYLPQRLPYRRHTQLPFCLLMSLQRNHQCRSSSGWSFFFHFLWDDLWFGQILQAKKLLAKYGSLISVISIVVLFLYLLVTPSKSGAAKKRR